VDELIPIGRFAALTSLSTKALRLYHDQGLLVPASVDPDSGYRYYTAAQIGVASRISLMRRAGVGLAEIAAFLVQPSQARIQCWHEQLDREVAERRRLLAHMTQLTAKETNVMSTTDSSTVTLDRAIPVLASLDLEATQRFYAEHLGFDPIATYPDYAVSARDGVQIHFWLTDDRRFAENTSCRIDVTGVDALYAELKASGVVHPNGQLTDQPWGIKEFAVLDADGNLIKFGERTSA
jgi:DNA-binding transcriptional MerR regulator